MRFIPILFFIFFSLHSYFVFAQDPSYPSGCSVINFYGGSPAMVDAYAQSCAANASVKTIQRFSADSTSYIRCLGCVHCVAPKVHDPISKTCITPTSSSSASSDGCPDNQPKVYDPVSGQMVCPGSGDTGSSAAASSQRCVVPGDFDGDCVPDEEQNSSANSSAPTSAPSSSPSSSGGDDGDDGGDDGGNNGGGGNNNGGNNSGGGSASSAASSQSGGAVSSASSGAGQCDPTAKNYLACIGSQKMSGEDIPWVPNSGYGNWLPVNENSPCVNKYQDSSGQWWCAAASNTPSSASGACDPTSTNYASCINSGATSSAGSSGAASSEDEEGLANTGDEVIQGVQEDIDSQLDDFENAYSDDVDGFVRDGVPFKDEPSAIKSLLVSFLPVSTSCNPPTLNFFGEEHELDCEYFDAFKQALGWFLAILTAYQIWQLAIRPVER